mgnify:CR=1 FL=1
MHKIRQQEKAERVSVSLLEVQKFRTHTDGKLIYLDAVQFRSNKMPEFMDDNNDTKNQNCDEDRYNVLHMLFPFYAMAFRTTPVPVYLLS